jgi:hypothetical protein
MQRDQGKSNPAVRGGFFGEITALVAVNGIIVLALIVTALSSPSASTWISAAAQAEFVGSDVSASQPTQIARPADMRIVRSN